jgi:type I restriction enzyme R subunit
MYVDKRLDGVQAVQTLSRLNRKIPGKENPFVLDFVNDATDIYRAFKPYYDATSLQEASDPQQLEALKHDLDAAQIYFWSEVEDFAKVFYKPLARQSAQDHAGMHLHLQPAMDRFRAMSDETKRREFLEKLKGYVSLYSFMSQIMPWCDPALEMLYSFGRFLLPHLQLDRDSERVKIADEVGLQYYRLRANYSGEIDLREGEPEWVKSPTDVGTGKSMEERAPLSEIIKVLNERFGTNFTEEDRLFFEQIREKATHHEQVIKLKHANPFDKFQLGLRQLLENLIVERMADNDKIVTRYMDDKEFGDVAFAGLAKAIYESIPSEQVSTKDG